MADTGSGDDSMQCEAKRWTLQRGTLEAVFVMHERRIAVVNFSIFASYMAMLTVICAESIIIEILGRPECCERESQRRLEISSHSSLVCPGRPGTDKWILKSCVASKPHERCPRITGHLLVHHRHHLFFHFLIGSASACLTWFLSSQVLLKIMGHLRHQLCDLQFSQERAVSLRPSQTFGELHAYLSQYKAYVLSTSIFVTVEVLAVL
eukprot:gnl/TRDRNA2_/TRDRNA2_163727_c1_seq1.p1 gnl/TRDRNA2_/TRDRNA2_163727_c1~~gnl/TRDRNA2_/TRDRNA2_163727_c1_seq1.p1  ORF type:complete len:215 (+),score=23.50 gnl/TRDRNA2_/TRDRNA2_163727_c1_seq1:23-646(+)